VAGDVRSDGVEAVDALMAEFADQANHRGWRGYSSGGRCGR
jgi:hypothetical protein